MGDCYRPKPSVDEVNAEQLDRLAANAPPIPEWFKPDNRNSDGYTPEWWENVADWAETPSVERLLQWPYWYAREVLKRRDKEHSRV